MHCSSCEPLLDRYLEGTLAPAKMAQIRAHVEQCANCKALLDEVKVVDALLFTRKPPQLAENFTFAVMAEVRSMPAVRANPHRIWSFLAVYVAAAWVAAVMTFALTGMHVATIGTAAGSAIGALADRLTSIGAIVPHAAPGLAAFGFVVLFFDAVLATGIAALYFGVRPRVAAAMAYSRRSARD